MLNFAVVGEFGGNKYASTSKKKITKLMKRYRVLKVIGDGTYGSVVRAQNIENGEIVSCLIFSEMVFFSRIVTHRLNHHRTCRLPSKK